VSVYSVNIPTEEVAVPNPYPLLYRLGLTPWENAADDGPIPELIESLPPGRALDAGCGTGRLAVHLAERGWQVTGVDGVGKALAQARERAAAAGVADRVRFVRGDVTRLDRVLGDRGFDLVTDVGCLHGLTHTQQRDFGAWVGNHTATGAHLVVLAVTPRKGLGPRGLDETGVSRVFGSSWSLVSAADSPTAGGGPLRGAMFRWDVLQR
jgi:SAM-dependent methyltransferase